jgi:hypothetical protein
MIILIQTEVGRTLEETAKVVVVMFTDVNTSLLTNLIHNLIVIDVVASSAFNHFAHAVLSQYVFLHIHSFQVGRRFLLPLAIRQE